MIAMTADIQLQLQPVYSRGSRGGVTSRLADRLDCMRWIDREAKSAGAKTVVVAGDFFHNRNSIPVPVMDAVISAMRKMSLNWRIVAGNHDCYSLDTSQSSLSCIPSPHKVIRETHIEEIGGIRIGYVAWADSPDVLKRGFDEMAAAKVKDVVSHFPLVGSIPDGGVDPQPLGLNRFRRVFLGDVHAPIKIGNVQYLGDPLHQSFDDKGARGFWLVDAKSATFVKNTISPKFIKCESVPETPNPKHYYRVAGEVPENKDGCWIEKGHAPVESLPDVEGGVILSPASCVREYVKRLSKSDRKPVLKAALKILSELE